MPPWRETLAELGEKKTVRGRPITKLTAKQQEVWDLRHGQDPPMTWKAIGEKLGIAGNNAYLRYQQALKKIDRLGKPMVQDDHTVAKEPEKVAGFYAALVDPEEKAAISKLAERFNLPAQTARKLAIELRSVYFPTKVEAKNVRLDTLKELWGMRAQEALDALTPEKIKEARAKDLSVIAAIATDKLLLLRGMPTQIVKTEKDRGKLEDLAAAFMKECNRRGYSVTPRSETGEIDITYDSQIKRNFVKRNVGAKTAFQD